MKIEIEFKKELSELTNTKEAFDILVLTKVDGWNIENGLLHIRGKKMDAYYSLKNILQFEIKK